MFNTIRNIQTKKSVSGLTKKVFPHKKLQLQSWLLPIDKKSGEAPAIIRALLCLTQKDHQPQEMRHHKHQLLLKGYLPLAPPFLGQPVSVLFHKILPRK